MLSNTLLQTAFSAILPTEQFVCFVISLSTGNPLIIFLFFICFAIAIEETLQEFFSVSPYFTVRYEKDHISRDTIVLQGTVMKYCL